MRKIKEIIQETIKENFTKEKMLKEGKRLFLSVLLSSCILTADPDVFRTPVLAWWGTLYPEFCLVGKKAEKNEHMNNGHTQDRKPKISFYLAKLLDW